jgi:outer membrane protein
MKKLVLALIVMFSVGAAVAQSKVGHVNTQKLLDTMPSRKEAMKILQDYETKGVEELQEMQRDFQTALAKYENDRANMPQVMIKIEEEKLMKKQQAVQDREQALQQEMQIFGQDLNQPILERVQKAVKIVAERKKLNYVLSIDDFSVILYSEGGTDITNEVITELLILDAAAMKK